MQSEKWPCKGHYFRFKMQTLLLWYVSTTTQQTYGLLIDIHTWYIHLLWVLLDTHWWQNVCCMEFNAVTRDHKYAHSTLTIQVCSKKSRVTLCRGSITVLTLCPSPLPSSLDESAPQHAHFSLNNIMLCAYVHTPQEAMYGFLYTFPQMGQNTFNIFDLSPASTTTSWCVYARGMTHTHTHSHGVSCLLHANLHVAGMTV